MPLARPVAQDPGVLEMIVAILIVALLLIAGPLRRSFVTNSRFMLPASAAALAVWIGSLLFKGLPREPGWYLLLPFMFAAAMISGRIVKEWLDDVFKEDK